MLSLSILCTQQGHIASSFMPTKSASAHSPEVTSIFSPMEAARDIESDFDLGLTASPDLLFRVSSEQQPFFKLEVSPSVQQLFAPRLLSALATPQESSMDSEPPSQHRLSVSGWAGDEQQAVGFTVDTVATAET